MFAGFQQGSAWPWKEDRELPAYNRHCPEQDDRVLSDNFFHVQDDPRWSLADPICTFVFAALVLLTTRAILRDISDILMERVPRSQDAQAITAGLFAVSYSSYCFPPAACLSES